MSLESLQQEVLSRPLDDEPRLVLADWFEEQGDVRGEFIRLQCQLANGKSLSGVPLTPRESNSLSARERKLKRVVQSAWRPIVPPLVRKWECIRGLPAHGVMGLRDFIENGGKVCSTIPLQSVALTAGANRLPDLIGRPWLEQMTQLEFSKNRFPPGAVATFMEGSELPALQTLIFVSALLDERDLEAIGHSKHIPSLRELQLRYALAPAQDDVSPLTSGPALADLEILQINHSDVSPDFLQSVSFGSTLRTLDLENTIGQLQSPPVVSSMLSSQRPLRKLGKLILNRNDLTNHAFTELVIANPFPELHTLGVNSSGIEDEGAFVFASSDMIENLVDVRMSFNNMTADGLRALWLSTRRKPNAKFYFPHQPIPFAVQKALRKEMGTFGNLEVPRG